MIYTDLTRKAIRLAYKAHDGQIDKSGIPYIMHPIHLAELMKDEDSCVVALLHDIVEDTDVTFDNLTESGFTQKQVAAIKALTHDEKVPYMVYIKEVRKNPLAATVKKADLIHNMDLTRFKNPTSMDLKRREKYVKAFRILEKEK